MTLAFSQKQARSILDTPPDNTLLGVRDRAMLAVGLQVGFRRAEIASLKVGDFHINRGFDTLRVVRKGGKKGSRAIPPQAAQRIRDYLDSIGIPILRLPSRPRDTKARWGEEGTFCEPMMGWI